jgi:hypothetical protein
MSSIFPDLDKIKVSISELRLTAMLCAILDAVGPVTLSPEQAAREWGGGARLQSETNSDGSLTLSLDVSHLELPEEEQDVGKSSDVEGSEGTTRPGNGERVESE